MVGPWQVPVADVRGDARRLRRLRRRGDGDGRAHAARAARRAGVGAHGGRRGDHQPRVRRRSRALATSSCRRNWMARRRPSRRGRARCTTRCAPSAMRAVPGAGHRDSGRQGLAVDAHALERRRGEPRSVTAPVSLVVTAFAPRRRRARARSTPQLRAEAGDADAAARRPRPRQEPPRRLGAGAGLRRSSATTPPDLDDPGAARGVLRRDAGSCAPRACCSRTTTAPTAACSSRCSRWRSRGGVGLEHRRSTRCRATIRWPRAVRRGARRGDRRCAPRRRRARARDLGAARPGRRSSTRSAAPQPPAIAIVVRARRPHALLDEPRSHAARAAGRDDDARDAALRDDPTCADEEQAARVDCRATRACRVADVRSRRRRRGAATSRAARGRASRSCASRASTARSRWRRPSRAPASTRSTCT